MNGSVELKIASSAQQLRRRYAILNIGINVKPATNENVTLLMKENATPSIKESVTP
jgi:hypothetical protein